MPTRSFDVVILGGGNAGMGVTVATREAGLTVAMIEPELLGGTCPNRGCMPKKVLVAAAHALDKIERAPAHHITVGKPSLDWAALIDREKAIIGGIPASLGELMKRRGVEVIRDRGRFVGPNAVEVGGETLEAKHIVIATGSKPRRLPFPGVALATRALEMA
jgi:glutathione reductase (NADPH)